MSDFDIPIFYNKNINYNLRGTLVYNFLDLAEKKISEKEYKQAIELCDKQIALGEDLPNAYYQKARAFYELATDDENLNRTSDDIKAALSLINQAITLNDKKDDFFSLSGDINWELKRYKRARFDYSQAIEIRPTDYNYYMRGKLFSDLEKYELAIKDFSKAVQICPNDADYLQELAYCLFQLDQFEKAICYYDKAIQEEEREDFYFFRGICFKNLRQYKNAISDIEKAIEINPEYRMFYIELANAYSSLPSEKIEQEIANSNDLSYEKEFSLYKQENNVSYKNHIIAIDYLKKAIEMDSQDISTYWDLTDRYEEIEDYVNANLIYDELEKMTPEDADVYYFRGRNYYYLNNFEKAIENFNEAIEIEPDYFAAYYFRGKSRKHLDEDLLSIGDICFAAKNGYSYAKEYLEDNYDKNQIETLLSATNKYQEICDKKDKLEDKRNKIIDKLYDEGKRLLAEKDYDTIIDFCEKAIATDMNHEKIYNLKAAVEIMLKKYDDAEKDCKKALSINPQFKEAEINLNLIRKIKGIK